ncbi:miniconductance mechanosensitive channel [Parabacteroides sp. PF5-5]|uniref:mechanosensitive ion channel family protein n=1 Tax=unclassified Parabacteroides TaxID=2649774 RepID=UPI002476F723|nr:MULTISPECIES: mechanosensitive ion channel domain-containing protein [unclassified Parabacteroides]MDH6304554.1 miniconductance mechanosensitive channel [Parabacteroides sp. PH5-39]MDH6315294.1 miniconductance mechanosensitive channel [Parabacteroides sp. PF5-13]MDH6319212.1 miniconductance mechanosensitive channel [Parabacteroides sp. PH5-13]MDH6322943.1 miniconductance mechanosensitive channel [Parabacteroides sp. PH5-8]MDH6326485.1 miniconductance mechanosensitive channel [Parabacteroide
MQEIQKWVYDILINIGLAEKTAGILDNYIILAFIIGLATIVNYTLRAFVLGAFKKIAARTKNKWDDLIVERKILNKFINIIPAILLYILLPLAFSREEFTDLLDFIQRLCLIYIIAIILRFIYAALGVVYEVFERKQTLKNKPLRGFIQIIQVILIFVGGIIIIAILINKSPTTLFAGLGASAAILTLVFKDTLMGFVAGIQLSANDMLRPGDWITMPKYGADGDVIEVSLNTVKVRNFDKTITTIPPSALINDSFQNWRGMTEAGGRRVKRSVFIDMNSVHFCSQEMLDKFRHIALLTEYIDRKEEELNKFNESQQIDNTVLVNGRRQTNLGVFRAYLERYLKSHPGINETMTCMVRHLQPTDKGIPIELYFFTSTTTWTLYEGIQADVFDHILAIIPEFGLSVFQNVSGSDLRKA